MVIGMSFMLLAILMALAIGYYVLLDRNRSFAALDRRIISVSVAEPSRAARMRAQMRVPDFMAPLLAQAQIEPTPAMLATGLGIFATLFVLALLLGGPASALIAAVVPVAGLTFYIRRRARKRLDILLDSLPFYLDGVRQLLMIGNSLSQALIRALPAAPPELQTFFSPATRRIELGAPIGESMHLLADRLRVPEISMLVAALRANLRFGGPMASVLGNLAQIMRERIRIKRELLSATSETKISTRVLIALPLVMIAFFFTSNRAYVDFFFHDPRGRICGMIALALQVTGMWMMRRMMRIAF